MGKAEGKGIKWHGHVTALTVAPQYRRLGLAEKMMALLEFTSEKMCGPSRCALAAVRYVCMRICDARLLLLAADAAGPRTVVCRCLRGP